MSDNEKECPDDKCESLFDAYDRAIDGDNDADARTARSVERLMDKRRAADIACDSILESETLGELIRRVGSCLEGIDDSLEAEEELDDDVSAWDQAADEKSQAGDAVSECLHACWAELIGENE
jgi:hypothetical protein